MCTFHMWNWRNTVHDSSLSFYISKRGGKTVFGFITRLHSFNALYIHAGCCAIYASKQSVKLKYTRKQKQNLSHLVCWLHNIPCSSNGLMSSTNLEWIFSIQVHLSTLYYKLITLLQVNVYCLLSHFVQSRDVVKRSNFSAKCVHSWLTHMWIEKWWMARVRLDHTYNMCMLHVTCIKFISISELNIQST